MTVSGNTQRLLLISCCYFETDMRIAVKKLLTSYAKQYFVELHCIPMICN